MNASWDNPPPDPPATEPVARTALHGTIPAVVVAEGSSPRMSGWIGRFDLWDLIIATVGFSIGFALVAQLTYVGGVLALTTLPAAGRVIYVRRRLAREGERLTLKAAALAFFGTVMVMGVAIIAAFWAGLAVGIIGAILLSIIAHLLGSALSASGDISLFTSVVEPAAVVLGALAGVVVLIVLPRAFWRRWDSDRAQLRALENKLAGELSAARLSTTPKQATPTKTRRHDGNPRRF